jgi:hypothetical protein
MAEEKKDPKAMLRRAARDIPLAALAYGLGYGIARTAVEHALPPDANPSALRRYGPAVLGAAAVYAGNRLDKELHRRITEER